MIDKLSEGYNKLKNNAGRVMDSVKNIGNLSVSKVKQLPYVYSCDNYLDNILSNALVRDTINRLVDKYSNVQVETIRQYAEKVNIKNYPRFWETFDTCCQILNVEKRPDIYITDRNKSINAITLSVDDSSLILFTKKSLNVLTDGELKFLIGHELGHYIQGNLKCHTLKAMLTKLNKKTYVLGSLLTDTIEVPLNDWYRCAEYTADRAGLLCCKDIKVVESLFSKVAMPCFETTALADYYELNMDHPTIKNRIKELKSYYKEKFISDQMIYKRS